MATPSSRRRIALGAVAIVVEEIPPGLDLRGRPAIVVPESRRALAALATRFYGEPSAELALIGVTGTNGKTSTTYLVESILTRAGRRVGLIGTLEARFAGQRRRAINTTPESLDLQTALRDMRNRGADAVVMEVSSHGLFAGTRRRLSVQRRRLHEPHPGSPRLPRHDGGLPRREGAALHALPGEAGQRRREHRRPRRPRARARGGPRRRARGPRLRASPTQRCVSRRPR